MPLRRLKCASVLQSSQLQPGLRLLASGTIAALLIAANPIEAQFRASIQGTIADPSGGVIPGATLTLTENQTNEKRTATSDSDGVYSFNGLPPGTFTLVAEHAGFETKTFNNVQIIPEQGNAFNVQHDHAVGNGERGNHATDGH